MSYSIVPIPDGNQENIGLREISVNGENSNSDEVEKYNKVLRDAVMFMKNNLREEEKIRDRLKQNAEILFNPPKNATKNVFHYLATTETLHCLMHLFWKFENEAGQGLMSREGAKILLEMNSGTGKKTPIHDAVECGFVEFVKEVLVRFPELVTVKGVKDHTLLHTSLGNTGQEGLQCLELIVRTARDQNLLRDLLLSKETDKEQIPLHFLCSRVPNNESAKVGDRLNLLLGEGNLELCNQTAQTFWEWDVDETGKTSLHLLCSKEEQANGYDTNENGKILLKKLIEFEGDRINEKTKDEAEKTALHLAVENGYHDLVEILVNNEAIDATKTDVQGRMPIHYAAEKAIWPKHRKCLEHLVNWDILKGKMKVEGDRFMEQEDLFKKYLVEDTCKGVKYPATALTLACLSKSTMSVELILRNLNLACKDPKKWFANKENESSKIFSLRPVFRHTPSALEFLFDKSIKFNEEECNERTTVFTTDLRILSGLVRPIKEQEVTSEIEYLGYANEWSEETKEKLLLHPLIQCSLEALWRQMRPFKLFWLIFNILWLMLYWNLVPLEYEVIEGRKLLSSRRMISAYGLATMIIGQVLYESDELYRLVYYIGTRKRKKAMRSFEINKWNWSQLMVTSLIVFGPCTGMQFLSSSWEGFLAGMGVLLAFLTFWRNISLIYLPWGIQVEYLIQTVNKILLAFFCCVPIIAGFERTFRQILPKDFTSASLFSLVRTLVMMTGEFEFKEMFETSSESNSTSANEDSEEIVHDITFKLVAFITFLLLLPIAFYNLVTGLVVDRIQQMQKTLEVKQILNHIRLMNHIHQTHWTKFACLFSWMSFLQPCYISYRFVVDGKYVVYDPELKWSIDKDLEKSSSIFSLILTCYDWCNKCFSSIFRGLISIMFWIFHRLSMVSCFGMNENDANTFASTNLNANYTVRTRCGNSLPENVKQRIFKLETESQSLK